MNKTYNPYKILGVTESATKQDLKNALKNILQSGARRTEEEHDVIVKAYTDLINIVPDELQPTSNSSSNVIAEQRTNVMQSALKMFENIYGEPFDTTIHENDTLFDNTFKKLADAFMKSNSMNDSNWFTKSPYCDMLTKNPDSITSYSSTTTLFKNGKGFERKVTSKTDPTQQGKFITHVSDTQFKL